MIFPLSFLPADWFLLTGKNCWLFSLNFQVKSKKKLFLLLLLAPIVNFVKEHWWYFDRLGGPLDTDYSDLEKLGSLSI